MKQKLPKLLPADWDFSALVDPDMAKPDRKKGLKTCKKFSARQRAALAWELSRECSAKQVPWLMLPEETQKIQVRNFEHPIRFISDEALLLFRQEGQMPKGITALGDFYSGRIIVGETPHVIAVGWGNFGIEEILEELNDWARETAKIHGRKKLKGRDPMSALWALAASRLDKAGHSSRKIEEKLSALPKFACNHKSFRPRGEDAARRYGENARKYVAAGRKLIEHAKRQSNAWGPDDWAQLFPEFTPISGKRKRRSALETQQLTAACADSG